MKHYGTTIFSACDKIKCELEVEVWNFLTYF